MRYSRRHRPDVMGGPQAATPDDEVMGSAEPDGTKADVMGGPRRPDEVMRGRIRLAGRRYGTHRDTDVMGGPSRPTDLMSPGE